MVLSSGEEQPQGRGKAGLVILVGVVLALAGAAAWHLTREAPGPAPTAPETAPRAAATPSPTAPPTDAAGTGELEVTGADGSVIFVDGRRLGPAPQRVDLEAGSHAVRVEKEGFRTFEREVHIVPGRTLEVAARLETTPPSLSVEADVPGAQVFLDRKFQGETPLVIRDLEPGPHRLNVSAEGYEGYSEDIRVAAGVNQIRVRFKEVRLDESLAVKHKHGMGSCSGRLVASTEGLRYETDHEKDGFTAPFTSLEPLEVDYLKKNLRVKVREERTYNFTAENADDLLTFQQAVEAVRERLR